MKKIVELTNKYNLYLVEDCAQSHGACFGDKMTGSFGDVGCFSFYPSKNLGAFGDGGAIVTNNPKIAEKVKVIRNYGSEKRYYNSLVGMNSRLDELQAGLLRVKLTHLEELTEERNQICSQYLEKIHNSKVILPKVRKGVTTVWHQFVVQCQERDAFINYLNERGIGTIIHYPVPPHMQEAYSYLGIPQGALPITEKLSNEVVSLPLYNGMQDDELGYIIESINAF